MPTWVIERTLVRDRRPGYTGERGKSVPRSAVDIWLAEVKVFGIRSIICLLGPDQLQLYDQLPTDLVSYYRQAGFEVEHILILDHQHPVMSEEYLGKLLAACVMVAKPVVVHCSASIDRTGMAVENIRHELATQREA